MQRAAAFGTARIPSGGRKISIEVEQLRMESGVGQKCLVQRRRPFYRDGEMAKTGRNDPCPCGSGKKYKQCCLAKDEAAARAARADQAATSPGRQTQVVRYVPSDDRGTDELTEASNAVLDLIRAGDLDAAERAAHDLLTRFPDVHDGYDRLGMVCEARGDHRQAADYYRKAIAIIRDHPDDYDPDVEAAFRKLVDRLDPSGPETPT